MTQYHKRDCKVSIIYYEHMFPGQNMTPVEEQVNCTCGACFRIDDKCPTGYLPIGTRWGEGPFPT